MYYNIAKRLLDPTLQNGHSTIAQACQDIVQIQYQKGQGSLKQLVAVPADLNQDRIDGLVDYVDKQESYSDAEDQLLEKVINFCQAVHSETIFKNMEVAGKTGFRPKLIRTPTGHCCDWCKNLAGVYDYYPDMDRDPFRRHDNCRCTVEYVPDASGRRQDVWSKKWNDEGAEGNKTDKNRQAYHDETDSLKKSPKPGDFSTESGYKPGKHKEEIEFGKWFVKDMGGNLVGQNERDIPWCDYLWGDEFWELKTLEKGTVNAINNAVRKGFKQIESASANSRDGTATGIMIDISKTDLSEKDVVNEAGHAFARHKGKPVYVMVIRDSKVILTVKLK